jgi:hypothetical protein
MTGEPGVAGLRFGLGVFALHLSLLDEHVRWARDFGSRVARYIFERPWPPSQSFSDLPA